MRDTHPVSTRGRRRQGISFQNNIDFRDGCIYIYLYIYKYELVASKHIRLYLMLMLTDTDYRYIHFKQIHYPVFASTKTRMRVAHCALRIARCAPRRRCSTYHNFRNICAGLAAEECRRRWRRRRRQKPRSNPPICSSVLTPTLAVGR